MSKVVYAILAVLVVSAVFLWHVNTQKKDIRNKISLYSNKNIKLTDNSTIKLNFDTSLYTAKLKIVSYIDSNSIGNCIGCRLKLMEWEDFYGKIGALKGYVSVFLYILPPKKYIKQIIEKVEDFNVPIVIDSNGFFGKENHKILSLGYSTFLLDENNRIILIGNPVQNPKIRDLYIRTICERLGIKPDLNAVSKPLNQRKNLGTFNWQTPQTTTFTIHNTGNESMLIDTLYTSCECTTAEIDKRSIEPTDSAIVSVKFNAEKPEMFMREIYVGVQGKEQIVLSIEGEAVE